MVIKILGTGCKKCEKLFDRAKEAVDAAGVDAQVVKVEDIDAIVGYGVPFTPALIIDEEVKSTGRVPKVSQIVAWIREQG